MKRKSEQAYVTMFEEVARLREFEPESIMVDFEIAAVRAFRHGFPGAVLKGYGFHFGQFAWLKVQHKCLSTECFREHWLAMQVRILLAISYVPETEIIAAFEILKGHLDACLTPILQYFQRNFVGTDRSQPVFPHSFW
jgi:hypothetical protein